MCKNVFIIDNIMGQSQAWGIILGPWSVRGHHRGWSPRWHAASMHSKWGKWDIHPDHVTSDLCKRDIPIFLFCPFIYFILRLSLCIPHWPQTLPPPETHDAQLTGYRGRVQAFALQGRHGATSLASRFYFQSLKTQPKIKALLEWIQL